MTESSLVPTSHRLIPCDADPDGDADAHPGNEAAACPRAREAVHDLKNLLLGIDLLVKSALRDVPSNGSAHNSLREVHAACSEAFELCREVLAAADDDEETSAAMERLRLGELLNEMRPLLERAVPKAARLRWELSADALWIDGSEGQLKRVVLNLVRNAGEALRDGIGAVIVRSGVTETGATASRRNGRMTRRRAGQYAYVEVSDTGRGMDESMISRLFEQRFSTKKSGHGLGLLSVRSIVAEHQGLIELHSAPERGTTIRILFPCASRECDDTPRTHRRQTCSPVPQVAPCPV